MKFTKEQLEKAKGAKSVEELLALAKESEVELTAEDAEKYFAAWNKEGELADEELKNVSGGSQCRNGSLYSSDPPYYLITTECNSCYGYTRNHVSTNGGICSSCDHLINGVTLYCNRRTYDNDPWNS